MSRITNKPVRQRDGQKFLSWLVADTIDDFEKDAVYSGEKRAVDQIISKTYRIKSNWSPESPEGYVTRVPLRMTADVNISEIEIYIFCNDDLRLTTYLVAALRKKGARNIRICYPAHHTPTEYANVDAISIPGCWETQSQYEWSVSNAVVVISMLYNNFEKQEMLLNACINQNVSLYITWDSGMELELYVSDKRCPRTRLHRRLIAHQENVEKSHGSMRWILFQVGIFDEEVLKHDISTITTAFNSPNQYIFLNVTVKEELAQLVAESIASDKVLPNRNYVVGDFVAHTFLGHVYQVANNGMQLDNTMPADISEFETTNQLRLSGIVSAPRRYNLSPTKKS
ncbi:21627_t:CDS:2 [Dentiscutata erythropus]|uniref:21627_t:CDS:1 n=1 Tax=Dentiscutata erythropus TaxID=1348616 RepID=A0A9N9AY23_9GLOM|nr:21627_t:CDS:2 [Dentiscutata erythropus]